MESFNLQSFDECESCLLGKMIKSPFVRRSKRANELLSIIYSDVCGPPIMQDRGSYSYFSRYNYVFFMRHKSKSFEKFKEHRNAVEISWARVLKYVNLIEELNT